MAGIKIDIMAVHGVRQYADRSIDIAVTERVRGDIVIRAQEQEARWLWAHLADMVPAWRREDGEE